MNSQSDTEFVALPASTGVALARKSEIVGGRSHEGNTSVLYLRSGPSLYVAATISQISRYLEAEQAELGRT